MPSRSRRPASVLLITVLAAAIHPVGAQVQPRAPMTQDTATQTLTLMSDVAAETVDVRDTVRLAASLRRIVNDRVAGVSIEHAAGRAVFRLNTASHSRGEQLFVVDGIPVSQGYAVTIPAAKVRGVDIITDSAAVRPYGLSSKGVVLLVSLRDR